MPFRSIPFIAWLISPFVRMLEALKPLGDLFVRGWVASIFFQAGMVKLASWESTLELFRHEYQVPLISPLVAAYLGTGAELVLPVFLILGLGGRLSIFMIFIYNIVCVISYPALWTSAGAIGLSQHLNWGLLLMLLMFHGPGKLSIDHWLRKRHGHHLHMEDFYIKEDRHS